MAASLPYLSSEQWAFLAVLDALPGPVSMNLIGRLVPLPPGPLFDLLDKAEDRGWIEQVDRDHLKMVQNIPEEAWAKLSRLNHSRQLSLLVDRIYDAGLEDQVKPRALIRLLEKADRQREASEREFELARKAMREKNWEEAWFLLKQTVERLIAGDLVQSAGPLFIDSVLQLSKFSNMGRVWREVERYLCKAHEVAEVLGDQRSQAMITLHLGLEYYLTNRFDLSLATLKSGLEKVLELGDDDILAQSAGFLGLYYVTQGLIPEAMEHLKRGQQIFESAPDEMFLFPLPRISLVWCGLFLGQFHWVIGYLDYNIRLAEENSDHAMAITLRAILGTELLLLKKKKEGKSHLKAALDAAIRYKKPVGLLLAKRGEALYCYLEGQMEQAYKILKQSCDENPHTFYAKQYPSPWMLEMLSEFDRLGFEPIPDFNYHLILEGIWKQKNVHLLGIALRLQARKKALNNSNRDTIQSDLEESEEYLKRSGDPVQLAKTRLEMARLALQAGEKQKARSFAQSAWQGLGGYAEEIFPDEFRHLVEQKGLSAQPEDRSQNLLKQYLEIFDGLFPEGDQSEALRKVVNTTGRFFGAERGALFWFPDGRYTDSPKLRAANNLTKSDIEATVFQPSRDLISQVFRTKRPKVLRFNQLMKRDIVSPARSAMCIPIEVQGKVNGALYFDNSYFRDAFDFLDMATFGRFAHHTNEIVNRIMDYFRIREKWQLLDSESYQREQELDKEHIIARSASMTGLLDHADKVAVTDSTVLIMGESGSGKELLAARLHQKSPRCRGPFIVIDATTIPENLFESELYGHEKGAFTGADRRKIGRIEMAHQGTLFIDEIGELPLQVQTKLLRVFQEKKFNRVGGNRMIGSNFRLIAASNRDLNKEVKEGRFREDLYFRLNVIPLYLPPLRERTDDIALLATHFLKRYAVKYKRRGLDLTKAQESMLIHYKWPGNVRELENIMERAVLLSSDSELEIHLPAEIQASVANPFSDLPSLEEIQRRYITHVLDKTGGKIAGPGGAAEILGLKRTSLYSRMRILKMNKRNSS